MNDKPLECRSDSGITVGLIDSLISICRVLAPRIKVHEKEGVNVGALWFTQIRPALEDLTADDDLAYVLGTMNRIGEDLKRVYVSGGIDWPGKCDRFVPPKGLPTTRCGVEHWPWEKCPVRPQPVESKKEK